MAVTDRSPSMLPIPEPKPTWVTGPPDGVIIAQGGAFGGWVLYAKDGAPRYCYNLLGLARYTLTGDAQLTHGTHQLRMEFAYDGGGMAKGDQDAHPGRHQDRRGTAGRHHPHGLLRGRNH